MDGYIASASTSKVTIAGVAVEWSNTDYTDYVAGGYWLHLDLASQGVEMGAFIDGPDYEGAVNLPATGTATYDGRAAGGYLTEYGTDASTNSVPAGTLAAGEYNGDLSLVANFGTNTISGGIDNILLFESYGITPERYVVRFPDGRTDYELAFGATRIGSNGQFTGDDVRLIHPALSFSRNDGSWAGRFSTVDDSDGNPRAVVGTHEGSVATSGGAKSIFVGTHYGATNQFQ